MVRNLCEKKNKNKKSLWLCTTVIGNFVGLSECGVVTLWKCTYFSWNYDMLSSDSNAEEVKDLGTQGSSVLSALSCFK